MSNLILLTNEGTGAIVLGEEFSGKTPHSLLRPGQSTIVRIGTTLRPEGNEMLKVKAEQI